LVEALRGNNQIRQRQIAAYSMKELRMMQSLLINKKQEDMEQYIDGLRDITDSIIQGKAGNSSMRKRVMQDAERNLFRIMRHYAPRKVKADIKEDIILPLHRPQDEGKGYVLNY